MMCKVPLCILKNPPRYEPGAGLACNRGKYTKDSSDVLEVFSFELRYISPDDKEWVCKTCDRTLVRGSMPVQAKANGLKLCEIPSELSRLNVLELRLICLRVPFMKMVALPAGKQKSIPYVMCFHVCLHKQS